MTPHAHMPAMGLDRDDRRHGRRDLRARRGGARRGAALVASGLLASLLHAAILGVLVASSSASGAGLRTAHLQRELDAAAQHRRHQRREVEGGLRTLTRRRVAARPAPRRPAGG